MIQGGLHLLGIVRLIGLLVDKIRDSANQLIDVDSRHDVNVITKVHHIITTRGKTGGISATNGKRLQQLETLKDM